MTSANSGKDVETTSTTESTDRDGTLEERVNRLESIVATQQQIIDAKLSHLTEKAPEEGPEGEDRSARPASSINRRETLAAGGVLALLGIGVGSVSAQSESDQGNSGGAVYNWQQNVDANGHELLDLGKLAMTDNPTAITDFAGTNLSIDENGVLNASFSDSDTRTNVSDDGEEIVQNVTEINFGYGLGVVDEGNGTVTITDDPIPPSISRFELLALVSSSEEEIILGVSFTASEQLVEIEVGITDGDNNTVIVFETDDFDESCTDDSCGYIAEHIVEEGGTYTATLLKAEDAAGNDGAEGQSDTVDVEL